MEVMTDEEVLAAVPGLVLDIDSPNATERGVVYCVARCWYDDLCNSVELIGVDGSIPALYYRKIEEINRCVRASKKQNAPVEV